MINDVDKWVTNTGILGDNMVGIWPPFSDKTDVNSTDLNSQKTLLATGDDFGCVKLFAWPVTKKGVMNKICA